MNSLSDFEERVWLRLLVNSDDYGVLPGDYEVLFKMCGFREIREKDFIQAVNLLVEKSLLLKHIYNEKPYVFFPSDIFDEIQTNLTNKTKSEFTRIKAKSRKEFNLTFSYINLYKKYPAKDRDKVKDNSEEGMQGEGKSEAAMNVPADMPNDNSTDYFRLKEMFREQFYPDRRELKGIQHSQFVEQLNAYGPERLETDIKICDDEGWKSVGSLKDYRSGKLKRKAVRYAKPEIIPMRRELRAPMPKEPQQEGVPMPDEVRTLIDGLGKRFSPSKAIPKPEPVIQDDSKPLPSPEEFLDAATIEMLRTAQREGQSKIYG